MRIIIWCYFFNTTLYIELILTDSVKNVTQKSFTSAIALTCELRSTVDGVCVTLYLRRAGEGEYTRLDFHWTEGTPCIVSNTKYNFFPIKE